VILAREITKGTRTFRRRGRSAGLGSQNRQVGGEAG
jgi:hypothetical protein